MNQNIPFDEKAIIEDFLRRKGSNQPTYPEASVRQFLDKIGEEIKRTGELRKDAVDYLLQQLHGGQVC